MQLSAVLDTVIGISFAFFLLSSACSAVTEGVATLLKKRGKYLLRGLRDMLEPATTAGPGRGRSARAARAVSAGRSAENQLVARALRGDRLPPTASLPELDRLLAHPLIENQMQRRATGELTRPPSYLSARTVSTALIDTLVPAAAGATSVTRLTAAIRDAGLNPELERSLLAIAHRARGDAAAFTSGVEHWYDDQMARVSGFYKRWAKRWIIVIAAVFVVTLHVDAIALAGSLWNDSDTRAAAVKMASPEVCADQAPKAPAGVEQERAYLGCLASAAGVLTSVGGPIGPPAGCGLRHVDRCLVPARTAGNHAGPAGTVLLGLLLSVLAAAFGAPFWFSVLTRAGSLRTTGDKPLTTAALEAAGAGVGGPGGGGSRGSGARAGGARAGASGAGASGGTTAKV